MLSEQLHQAREEIARTRTQLTMARQGNQSLQILLDSPLQQERNVRARRDYSTQANITDSTVPPLPSLPPLDAININTNNQIQQGGVPLVERRGSTVPPLDAINANNQVQQANVSIIPRGVANLSWNASAAHINSSPGGGKGITISGLLQMLYQDNRFTNCNSWKNITIPLTLGTPILALNTLELCQCVMNDEELSLFQNKTFPSDEDLLKLTNSIEIRAFKAMWSLEGVRDVEQEYAKNQKLGSRKKRATYLAIGARVRDYKKTVSGSTSKNIYNAVVLRVDESVVDWNA